MSIFDDRFTNHGVFTVLETLRTRLETATEHLSTTEVQEQHARIVQAADYIERVLKSADPALTSKSLLDALQKSLQNATTEVQAFANNKQPPHLVNANSHVDSALQQVASLNVPQVPADVEGLRDDVANFRNSASHLLRSFEKKVTTAKTTLDQKVTEAQQSVQQTTAQIESKLAEVESEKKALEALRTQLQGQFSDAQDRRSKEFNDAVSERTKQFQELVNESRQSLEEQLDTLVAKTDEYLEEFELRRAEVQKVVGAIGADAHASGFSGAARNEEKAANRWRWIGVGLYGAAIVAAGLLFGPLHQVTELIQIGAKAVVVIPLVGLGTYALKESGKHRRIQWRNRRLAIELASIDPYLALFEDTERNTVKKALAERWFAQPEGAVADEAYSPSVLVRLLEQAIELLGKKI